MSESTQTPEPEQETPQEGQSGQQQPEPTEGTGDDAPEQDADPR